MSRHGQVVLGIDTHKNTHVAALVDDAGRLGGLLEFAASDAGARRLLTWAQKYGRPTVAGVEGTGSYGYQLARRLKAAGITVLEVNRPDRSRRRRKGKSDPVDAEAAARAVIAGEATAILKDREGGALRALSMARSSAVKAKTQATNQIRALLIGCPEQLRKQLTNKKGRNEAMACSRLHPTSHVKTRCAVSAIGGSSWTTRWRSLTVGSRYSCCVWPPRC
jgi:transposase